MNIHGATELYTQKYQDDKLYVMCTLPHFLNFLINLFYRWTEKDVEAKEVFDNFITT